MAAGYLRTKYMAPEEYHDISHQELIEGDVKLFSDVKTMEEETSRNKQAMTIAWAVVFQWLKAVGGTIQDKLRLFLSLFGAKDMQERGMIHHVSQTGKAKSSQGMYARHAWVVELVLKAETMYRENTIGAAIPGVGGVPWTMYWTRLASGTAAVAEIGRGTMRRIYRSLSKKEKLPTSANVLLEADGLAGFGVIAGPMVTYTDIWNDNLYTGQNLHLASSVINQDDKGNITITGGVLNLKIIGVETEQEFPYTRFWPGAGMIPNDRVQRKTLEAYFWKDELDSRPKRLKFFKQPDKKIAEEARMTTHGWSWYVTTLWPIMIPARSPFAGRPLDEWESFPETAKDVEKVMVEWINAAGEDSVPMDEVKNKKVALDENPSVWEKIVDYMRGLITKEGVDPGDLIRGIPGENVDDEKAISAALTWKAGKANFNYYVRWWGTASFAPYHSLEIGKDGLLSKKDLNQDDLDNSPNKGVLKDEYDTLKAHNKATENTHLGFLKSLQIRFGIISKPTEVFPDEIRDIVEANVKMGQMKGAEETEEALAKMTEDEINPPKGDKVPKSRSLDGCYPDVKIFGDDKSKKALEILWNFMNVWAVNAAAWASASWEKEGKEYNASFALPDVTGKFKKHKMTAPLNKTFAKTAQNYIKEWTEDLVESVMTDVPSLESEKAHLQTACRIIINGVTTYGVPSFAADWIKGDPPGFITTESALGMGKTLFKPAS